MYLYYRVVEFFVDIIDTARRLSKLPSEVERLRRKLRDLEGSAE